MAVRLSDVDAINLMSNGSKLLGWLDKFNYFSPKKVEISKNTPERFDIKIYTDSCVYRITATNTYLGCTAASRKPRPGEKWTRGNDLPDGKFNEETFHRILGAILFYEAKDVVKDRVDVGEEEVKPPVPATSLEVSEEIAKLIQHGIEPKLAARIIEIQKGAEVEGFKFNESDPEFRETVVK